MHGNGEASNADIFAQQGAKPKQKTEGTFVLFLFIMIYSSYMVV